MRHCCHAGVVVVLDLIALHAAHNLVVICNIVDMMAFFLCVALLPYTALSLSSATVNADMPCPLLLLRMALAWAMLDVKALHPFLVAFTLPPSLPYTASLLF
jgi:hypothetical protein